MRWDGFRGTLVFAAMAAASYLPFAWVVDPWLGGGAAARLYLVGLCTLYAAGLAPHGAARVGVAAIVALASAWVASISGTLAMTAVGLTAVLALARSGYLRRTGPARALGIEAVLVISGLGVAAFLLGSGSTTTFALAIWGFFLTQSVFFLFGTSANDTRRARQEDPFERALARALALLDDDA